MTASGYINASQDKMHSTFDSVAEQSGIYAGKGGFDITVGNHTQLDGAVIASTATADKNHLDTGTLGFSDMHNEADFKTEHSGVSLSGGGSFGGDTFKGNMPGGMFAQAGSSGHAQGTTQSAIADGTITVRDRENQQQDVASLSRDTAHANDSISPIFDKEKEQKRLQTVQLISDIGGQAADIARTQGDLNGLKEAKKDHAPLKENATEQERDNYLAELRNSDSYKAEMDKFGTGSNIQRGIQAATAVVQGLAGGDIANAIAGGSAPYIANIIGNSGLNDAGKVLAHAAVNAALTAAQGNQVRTFTTASDLTFVRVSTVDNPVGGFLVRANEIAGMTPTQIQQYLALPKIPTQIADVTVPAGTKMQVGKVAAQPQFDAPNSGGVQYQLLQQIPTNSFGIPRPLK